MTTEDTPPLFQRRREFIEELERLSAQARSANKHVASPARRTLAQLRRTVTGQRHEHGALKVVFDHQPPRAEERIWLTVAGLFSLNPQADGRRLSLGAALQRLDQQHPSDTAEKRLRQLLAADAHSLPQHLRSTLRLLASHDIPVDFHALLGDAIVLLGPDRDEDKAREVHWNWASDFHRNAKKITTSQENKA